MESTVRLRLFDMECCRMRLLWIEDKPPVFCPSCKARAREWPPLRTLIDDPNATLVYQDEDEGD